MVDITHMSQASTTAASNLAVQGVSDAEGWLPSTVNNFTRASWAILAGFYSDLAGLGTTGGTANAITITNVVPIDSLRNGQLIAWKNSSGPNTGATTINIDGKGAKAARLQGDVALIGDELQDDGIYLGRYDAAYDSAAGAVVVLNPSVGRASWTPSLGGSTTYTVQAGRYTRKGKEITVWGQITVNAIGTGSTTTITGLPFAMDTAVAAVGYAFRGTGATNLTSMGAIITTGAPSSVQFFGETAAAASDTVPVTLFQNATNVVFTITYRTA